MSYEYNPRTHSQLEGIATIILQVFANRRLGVYAVDIEAILEDMGMDIIYRPLVGVPVLGYLAKDARLIVLNELKCVHRPRARSTIAEEVSHRVLEWQLWKNTHQLPDGASFHDMVDKQYNAIERDAKYLGAAILMPKESFTERFNHHVVAAKKKGHDRHSSIVHAAEQLSDEFEVSRYAAGLRAKKLTLITEPEYGRCFPVNF